MQEGQGSDGGFLVPPAFRAALQELVFDDTTMSLLNYVNTIPLQGNSLEMPSEDTTPWGTEGVQAYWTGEGQEIQASQAKLNMLNLKLDKLAVIVPLTSPQHQTHPCLLYTSPSPRDRQKSRMPSSA